MRNFFFALILTIISCAPVYAISEAEFQKLLKSSPVLQEADKLLNQTWKEVNKNIPKANKKLLLAQQREWIKNGRDETARIYSESGYDKACAYAIATLSWVKDLRVFEYNANLSEEAQERGSAKADGAFWNEEEDIPMECRK